MIKQAPWGFSWTVLCFNFLVPLCRDDTKWTWIMLLLAMLTVNCSALALAFFYNTIYLRELLEDGWQPLKPQDRQFLVQQGILAH